jgi:uncharacterized protein (DUF983 family)
LRGEVWQNGILLAGAQAWYSTDMRFRTIFLRSCRLRCPRCGQGKLFRNLLMMNERCPHCDFQYGRGPGYFLGSIYFNYGLTALLVTAAFLGLFLLADISPDVLLWPLTAFTVVFPLLFFPFARSLWVGFDQFFDPVEIEREEGTQPGAPSAR